MNARNAAIGEETKESVRKMVGSLEKAIERKVIKMRYGINKDGRYHTLKEAGHICGITDERVRQIETSALRNLRRMLIRKH